MRVLREMLEIRPAELAHVLIANEALREIRRALEQGDVPRARELAALLLRASGFHATMHQKLSPLIAQPVAHPQTRRGEPPAFPARAVLASIPTGDWAAVDGDEVVDHDANRAALEARLRKLSADERKRLLVVRSG